MSDDPRILETAILDELPEGLVAKAVEFFNQNYPGDSKKRMESDFFSSKLGPSNPNGHGYFTVATYNGEVVGTCTAVRKTLISGDRIIQAVEIGDTYTSKVFRKSCQFAQLYPETKSIDDYLNKSIFGRLASETLDRARADGVEYVYGTPNLQAKLSWLGRMNFKLVDGNYTYRISSPSRTHPIYNSSISRHFFGAIYTKISFLFCSVATRKYSVSLIAKQEVHDLPNPRKESTSKDTLKLLNSHSWIHARFVNNNDKEYKIVKITRRGNNQLCGYLFFFEYEREDNFKLLILSKDLLNDKKLERLKIPISKIAADKFFKYENLSVWVDVRRVSLKFRAIFGFLSKEFKVDIVGKSLAEVGAELVTKNFYDFQYGDSDLA